MTLVVVGGTENPERLGDVVFVHGLAGDPRATWTYQDSADGFWPGWLARDCPDLGVWSVGYEVAVSAWQGVAMPLFDRANNVLAELATAGIGSRPLCFVTHSMGGLLVKYMLRNADTLAPEFADMSRNIRGVIFIATPHTGSDLARLAGYLKYFLRPTTAVRDLEHQAPALRDLNLWYRQNADRLGVITQVSFETLRTKGVHVVDAVSADPGLKDVTPIGIDADHVTIAKPPSAQSLVYLRSRQFIKQIFEAAGLPVPEPPGGRHRPFLVPPPPAQGVIGRERELSEVRRLLDLPGEGLEDSAGKATGVPPVVLRGMGGIGKTTLAVAVGRDPSIARSFSDGVLWAEVGPNPVIRSLLNGWGVALGVDLVPQRDESACRDQLRDILSNKRMLLLVDDVWEVLHGEMFQVAGPYCRTVFTTRESPVAHALTIPTRTLRVGVLDPKASLELLASFVPDTVAADVEAARQLCVKVEYLPLALKLAGRLLASEADVPGRMWRLVRELTDRGATRLALEQAEGRKGLGDDGSVSLKAILGLSVERLTATDQARFAMTAVFGGEPLTWEIEAAAAVWQCATVDAEKTVSQFVQRGLAERWNRPGPGQTQRYWTHALLADYAADMMRSQGL